MPEKQVVDISEPTTGWTSSHLFSLGRVTVNGGCLGHLKEHITCRHPLTQSARAAEGQSFFALSTLEPAEPGFPATAGRHVGVGSAFRLPSQLLSACRGLC